MSRAVLAAALAITTLAVAILGILTPAPEAAADGWQSRVPAGLLRPPGILEGDEAVAGFTRSMWEFLSKKEYRDLPGWVHDQQWRTTGTMIAKAPLEGPLTAASLNVYNEGTHPFVRVYYSPGVRAWLEGGSVGEIPDGEMVIKEMCWSGNGFARLLEEGGFEKDRRSRYISVHEIPAVLDVDGWAIMVKRKDASYDGWYWGQYYPEWKDNHVPSGRSATTDPQLEKAPAWPPTAESWKKGRPTGQMTGAIAVPASLYGAACINCHASAAAESTFSSLVNIDSPGVAFPLAVEFVADPAADGEFRLPGVERVFEAAGPGYHDADPGPAEGAFRTPAPSESFRKTYPFFDDLTWSEVWEGRFPARTWDHVPSGPDGPGFMTSDQCQPCHSAAYQNSWQPPMELQPGDGRTLDLSPFAEWSASMMGLGGRDPIFFAQMESEQHRFPGSKDVINNTCLKCHGAMGQRQFHAEASAANDFDALFTRSMIDPYGGRDGARIAALARDAISCAVCHRMAPDGLGTAATYTGNFSLVGPETLFGPYEGTLPKSMEHALGITPVKGAHLSTSALCGSCHTIELPIISDDGRLIGTEFEQTTYFEWQNSIYQDEVPGWPAEVTATCQECHMKSHFEERELSFRVASIQDERYPFSDRLLPLDDVRIPVRKRFRRHTLNGINLFALEMFSQFPVVLGIQQKNYLVHPYAQDPLRTATEAGLRMARHETARVTVDSLAREGNRVEATVEIENLAGHNFPTGVAFRRAFLEFVVLDARGEVLWASGRTSDVGVILEGMTGKALPTEFLEKDPRLEGAGDFQPHHEVISEPYQVQIYEEIIRDEKGRITTSFLNLAEKAKDNRLRPKGWSPTGRKASITSAHGRATDDPCYTDGARTGSDRVTYRIELGPEAARGAASVRATLYYQATPPYWLRDKFRTADGPSDLPTADTRRLYFLAANLDTKGTKDDPSPIEDWKLRIAGATREIGSGD